MIITVNRGDTLFSLYERYGVPISKITADNGIVGEDLVVGQSLIIDLPEKSLTVPENTTADGLSAKYGIEKKTLFRNNYFLGGRNDVKSGSFVVLSYADAPQSQKIIGGYAYDFISTDRLFSVISYLTYIMPFTYGFTEEGELIPPNDDYILFAAETYGVKGLMHISTLNEEGYFDSNLPSYVFDNDTVQSRLIDNILSTVESKEYYGVDIDFEYLTTQQKSGYAEFTARLSDALHQKGKILVIAVPPKASEDQQGSLVEGIDYEALGKNADYILIMTYEYGYKFGPPLAIAPVNQITRVLDYATKVIEPQKILLGISNYGYDWTLPYVRGESDAPSISTVEAVELAKEYGSKIQYDEISKAPYFFYTDKDSREHEVWFEDARSFDAKMNLIKDYNLAGGFIWDLMRENPQGYVTLNSRVKII